MGEIAKSKVVKVVKLLDETIDKNYLGMEGLVVDQETKNGKTIWGVMFNLNTVPRFHKQYDPKAFNINAFWSEELEVIS